MKDADDLLTRELKKLPAKPVSSAGQAEKRRYSELMSAAAARALAEALRRKGLKSTLPLLTPSGAASNLASPEKENNGGEEDYR